MFGNIDDKQRYILSGSEDGCVYVWDLITGTMLLKH